MVGMTEKIAELRFHGQAILNIAEALSQLISTNNVPIELEAPTLEEVRASLAKLSVAGHSAAVKSLIAMFGANKLSDIAPEQYAALLKEAERIGT